VLLSLALVAQPADLKSTVTSWATAHRQAVLDELLELLAIPNVASDTPNIQIGRAHV